MFGVKKRKEPISHNLDYEKLYDILSQKYANLEMLTEEKDRVIERVESDTLTNVTKSILLKTINLFDDFERLYENISDEIDIKTVMDGIDLIHKNTHSMLKSEMVDRIKAVSGTAFDPKFHEAFASVESDEFEEGIIVEEIRSGYLFEGKLLRASRVIVSKGISSKK